MLRAAFRAVGTVAPGVAARWAEIIFCSPPRNEARPGEEAFLATGTRLTVRAEDQDLAVDRDDPDVPYAHGEEIAGAWPGAQLVVTTGLGHRALLRDPEVIRRTVTFLSNGAA
jgi:pimeloyl-ACP methyl ester carboxylesterase